MLTGSVLKYKNEFYNRISNIISIKVEWNLAREKAEGLSSAFCLYFTIFLV